MTWTMPAETAPHDRIWMAFPRAGVSLGATEAEAERGYAAWADVANTVAQFEPVDDGGRPERSASRTPDARPRPSVSESPRSTIFGCATSGPPSSSTNRARSALSTGPSTPGALPTGRPGQTTARSPDSFRADTGAQLVSSTLVNEGGAIHVDGEGTVLVTETVQLDPGATRTPTNAGRGRTGAHDRCDTSDLAAPGPHPRLREVRHSRARRHGRGHPVAGCAAAAPAG